MENKKGNLIIFIGLLIGMGHAMLMQTILTVTLPSISIEFEDHAYYAWVYSGYMLASTVTMPLFSKLCDSWGYKTNYMIGALLFLIGTLWSGLSQSMLQLVLARVVMGIGSGIVVPATYGIVGEIFRKEQLVKVFAFFSVFQIIGNMVGSFLGGLFVTYLNWRIGILMMIPTELIGFAILYLSYNGQTKMQTSEILDMKSGFLMLVGLISMMLGISKLSSSSQLRYAILFLVGTLLLIVFVVSDIRKENGILPKEIKHSPVLVKLVAQIFLIGIVVNACLVYLPNYMQTDLQMTPKTSSYFTLFYVLVMGIASSLYGLGKISQKIGVIIGWISLLLGSLAAFISYIMMNQWVLGVVLAFYGMGLGILVPLLLGRISQEATESKAGVNSLAHLIRNMGGTIGVTLLQFCMTVNINILFASILGIAIVGLIITGNREYRGRLDVYR